MVQFLLFQKVIIMHYRIENHPVIYHWMDNRDQLWSYNATYHSKILQVCWKQLWAKTPKVPPLAWAIAGGEDSHLRKFQTSIAKPVSACAVRWRYVCWRGSERERGERCSHAIVCMCERARRKKLCLERKKAAQWGPDGDTSTHMFTTIRVCGSVYAHTHKLAQHSHNTRTN